MPDVMLVLMRIEELEGKISELYEWLSKLFNDKKEVSSFFARMSLDEKQHKDLAGYQIRVVRKNRSIFPDIEADLSVIEGQLSKIGQFRSGVPTPESAIRFALEIEKHLCEQYYREVLKQSNKEISTLIDNLAKACEDHYKDCLEFAKKHGIGEGSGSPEQSQ
jgi:rubrerythrin